MRAFLARAADYTLTPLPIMLRLATRAPGLGAPPAARPLLRLTGRGARPDDRRRGPGCSRPSPSSATSGSRRPSSPQLAGVSSGRRRRARGAGRAGARGGHRATRRSRASTPRPPPRPLSAAQAAAAARLRAAVRDGRYSTTLLKGVTGSGKTEVYLEAVAEALRAVGRRWCCCPRSRCRSSSSTGSRRGSGRGRPSGTRASPRPPRRRAWIAVATGDARLVVGARSALFLPFADLGLVVVDEEHDGSYKQEDGACYHARDMAVLRASIEGAAVVLASATPSLESWANADAGKYARLDLPERFGVGELPEMRRDRPARVDPPEPGRWISGPLVQAVSGAAGRRRAGAAVPQPARLCAADDLPGLRPPGRLRRTATRAWSSTASASGWSATSAARRSRSRRLPGLQGRGADDGARARASSGSPRRRRRSGRRRGSRSCPPTSPTGRGR